ncbi:MAG: ycgS, partial [Halanaerobium sp.]
MEAIKMESKIAELKKGKMEYTLRGEGPVISNLHGGHSNCQESFGYQPLLNSGYSILTPSRPGYSRTDVEAGRTAAETAASLVELLDYLKIGEVYLIGVSAGGPTAIYLTANYPARVKKLVLESAASKAWLTKNDLEHQTEKEVLQKIEVPTLVMHSKYDKSVSFE